MDATAIITRTNKRQRSSDYDLVRNTVSEADRAVTARNKEIKRAERCWRMYSAFDGGQWDEADKATLRKESRHAAQFNVIAPKIDALAGALLADLPDVSWAPVQGQKSDIIDAVAEAYFSDKELFDYDTTMLRVFKAGLVHSGDAYIYINRQHGQKRICLGKEEPGFLLWDPFWKTDNDRDAEVAYRFRYLKPDQIIFDYNHKAEELLAAIIDKRRNPADYPLGGASQRRQLQGKVGDEYKVIEKHYLKRIKGTRLIGRREGSEQWIPFPVGKDQYYLTVFAELNQIDWTTVLESRYEDRIHYTTAVCEELNILLSGEEKSEVQVNGLPFFHFSAKRYAGEDAGIVDDLVDLQQTINKRESLVTELVSKANGGATIIDNSLFLADDEWERFIKERNKPGAVFKADLNGGRTPMLHLAANQYPSTVLDQINRMYEILPRLSRASDALSSMSESGESGILFERKIQMNMVVNALLNREVRQFINNVGEAYFYTWQCINADIMREVDFRDGRKLMLNEPCADGTVRNAVSEVPRCRVVVTENTKSQVFQMRYRGVWSEVLRSIPPDAAPAHFMFVLKKFFETLQLSDEDKEDLKMLNEMMLIKARVMSMKDLTALQAGIQGDTLQSAQIQMQLEQLAQQQAMAQQQQEAQAMGMGGGMPQGQDGQDGAYPVQLPQEQDLSGGMGGQGGMPPDAMQGGGGQSLAESISRPGPQLDAVAAQMGAQA